MIAKIIKTILLPRCFHSLISRLPIAGIPHLPLYVIACFTHALAQATVIHSFAENCIMQAYLNTLSTNTFSSQRRRICRVAVVRVHTKRMSKAHERFHDVIILCDKQRLAFVCIGYESGTCQLGHQCLTTQTPDFVKVRLLPLKQHDQGNFSLPASYSPPICSVYI